MCPVISEFWQREQEKVAAEVGNGFVLMGDGRADSPGHTAKYLVYSFLDAKTNKVVHMEFGEMWQVC